jgi:hypothetical protein
MVIVPRGLPRTAFSLARAVAIVMLLRSGDAAEPAQPPPRATVWGVVNHVPAWDGPDTPYRFIVHPYDGDRGVLVTYRGDDPKLVWGDEVWATGERQGKGLVTDKVVVVEGEPR